MGGHEDKIQHRFEGPAGVGQVGACMHVCMYAYISIAARFIMAGRQDSMRVVCD